MARDYKKNPRRKREQESSEQDESRLRVRQETKHGIIAIIFVAAAILSILSFFKLADVVGIAIDRGLTSLFGWGKYVIPIFFGILAWMFWKKEDRQIKSSNWVGFVLFVLSYSGLFHLLIEKSEAVQAITDGRGGGYIGLALSYPLRSIMGPWATGVLLIGLLLIALLLWFDTSLPELADKGNIFSRFTFRFRRFRERMQRNWTMRNLEERSNDDATESFHESEGDIPSEDADNMAPEVAQAIAETEERLKTEAKQYATKQQRPLLRKRHTSKPYPLNLLESGSEKPTSGDITAHKEIIKKTLETFGINVEMGDVSVGPTVTQYTLRPSEGVKLSQITTLSNDLALALAAHPIRIEAPIPGKSLVGIEVPNESKAIVKLRDVLDTAPFKKRESDLTFVLGQDVAGNAVVASLDRMPHMLIAGATGSGKSVCINTLLLSLLYTNSPDSLRLILVDPKRVELTPYNNIPHLLTPVITSVEKTINALRWVTGEMDRRFRLLEETGKRNIQGYNSNGTDEQLPYIVVVIDELADLMAVAATEVEGVIIRLAQMARAVGIHLVVATQRPSVDVITGLIKANITSRVAFSVASGMDSRTILDTTGAEKLLGRGDMLYISAELSKPRRLQGAFVNDQEIEAVTTYVKSLGNPDYVTGVVEKQTSADMGPGVDGDSSDDELYDEAKDLVVRAGKASASYLQRRLRIGYARAARLLDLLEEHNVIGPGDGAKAREVYLQSLDDESAGTFSPSDYSNEPQQDEPTDESNELTETKEDKEHPDVPQEDVRSESESSDVHDIPEDEHEGDEEKTL
ncbi:MAG: DNA translocase FtsK 4TM domain-containing protein [Patescibacteria group bacterium]|jgi:S-DNA-T family DNA segregation ATPase FtsK/SpoIIIE